MNKWLYKEHLCIPVVVVDMVEIIVLMMQENFSDFLFDVHLRTPVFRVAVMAFLEAFQMPLLFHVPDNRSIFIYFIQKLK